MRSARYELLAALLLLVLPCAASFVIVMPTRRPTQLQAKKTANHEKWQPYFEKLVKYKDEHGHCHVPTYEEDDTIDEDTHALGVWVKEQQRSYEQLQAKRKTKLTKKRATALELLGAIGDDVQ